MRLTGGALLPPTSPAPAAWWVHGAEGNGRKVGLGLLTWVPVAQPAAVPYGENLVDHVTHIWGEICSPPAGPTPQLWTFDGEPTGPNPTGWFLTGLPWPDAPGSTRSTAVRTGLRVGEAWRVAGSIDPLQGTAPAVVVGGAVPCFDGQRPDPAGIGQSWAVAGPHEATGARGLTLLDVAVGAAGLYDAGALLHTATWRSNRAQVALGCRGEILRSPALDSDEPAPNADDDTRKLVEKAWEATGFRPDELADAVWFEPQDPDDGFTDVGVLLLVDRRVVEGGLFVVGRAADGSEVRRYPVRGTDLLSAQNRPSDHWFDPDGPWADPVSRAGHLAAADRRRGRAGAGLGLPEGDGPVRPGGSSSGSTARVPASCHRSRSTSSGSSRCSSPRHAATPGTSPSGRRTRRRSPPRWPQPGPNRCSPRTARTPSRSTGPRPRSRSAATSTARRPANPRPRR